MSPFQSFRLWSRRAPLGERAGAGLAATSVVAAMVWVLLPSSGAALRASTSGTATVSSQASSNGSSTQGSPAATTPPGQDSSGPAGTAGAASLSQSGGSGGSGPAGTTGSGGKGTASQGSQPGPSLSGQGGGGGCVSPPGTDQGLTASQLKVAVVLINVVGPAADSAFGVAPPAQQEAGFQDVVDSINAGGGIACRKVVPTYYQANPIDQSNLQQTCLDIAQTHPFFVIDTGAYAAYTSLINCFPQNQLPIMAGVYLPTKQYTQFYPYLFGQQNYEVIYKDTVLGLAQRGWFTSNQGFHKLGFLYRDCAPELPGEELAWLKQAGVPSSSVVSYNLGCPGLFASPSDLEQAVLKFQQNGVTNFTLAEAEEDFANFTNIAEQQGFHPRYGLSDNVVISQTYANNHPNFNNLAGAVAVANDRWGEEHTPGTPLAPGTVRCNQIFTAHGEPPVYMYPDSQSGEYCDQLWTLQAAVDHAPALQRIAVAAGLQAVGTIDYSFPYGPAYYRVARTTWGGTYWRVDQYVSGCTCWRLLDPTFHPSFP